METKTRQSESPVDSLPRVVKDLLRKRGFIESAAIETFLNPNYDQGLGDPFLMKDMDKAVDRILTAAKKNEKVAIYGDYDIDGISSTTLMMETLQLHGIKPITYIPDRYEEGYGINLDALKHLKKEGVDLVISVDCGITNVKEAKWAKENGLDLVITDHHEVPEELPKAEAVVNPKQPGDKYPFKELAGVGVAFAVARALQKQTGVPTLGQEKWMLDLVALGTVCDVMPLVDENRVLVKFGLIVLRKSRRPGLVALAQSAGVELADAKTYHIGYIFGPRLNAAGRLEHANYSLELMLTKDPIEAQAFAFQLEELNHQRQLETDRILKEADAMAAEQSDDPVLVLVDPGWPHGIVGIVASKIAEKWQKPTLILQQLDDLAKGSARSANGYNLIEGLRTRADLFTKLGGHHFAAGFTLPIENIDELRTTMNEHYLDVEADLPPRSQREADIELESPTDINWDLYNALSLLEPYGTANPEPALGVRKIKVVDVESVGKTKNHLKLRLAGDNGVIYEGIGFGLVEKHPNIKQGQLVDVLGYMQKREWNGRSSLQLILLHVQ